MGWKTVIVEHGVVAAKPEHGVGAFVLGVVTVCVALHVNASG